MESDRSVWARPEEALERRSVGPLTLLKEDLSQFRDGVLRAFKDKDSVQPADRSSNALVLLRDDLNSLRDDLSSVFRIGADGTRSVDEPVKSLFGLLKTSVKAQQEVRRTTSHEDVWTGDGGTEEDVKGAEPGAEGSQSDQRTESFSETRQKEETVRPADAANQGAAETEGRPAETLSWNSLCSEIDLFRLTDVSKDLNRADSDRALWSLKNFACYLTLDPNSANAELRLSDGNRMATRYWLDRLCCQHPERFERCPQVLCREGLLDSAYWEVEWSGGVDVGVAYNSICRDGDPRRCLLGHSERSWSLECSEGSYTPCHRQRRFRSTSPLPFSRRVGVYLDWPAGALSFYCVSSDAMTHLHTFSAAFTEPLYPGFWIWSYDGSVTLCHVELDWERQLQ